MNENQDERKQPYGTQRLISKLDSVTNISILAQINQEKVAGGETKPD